MKILPLKFQPTLSALCISIASASACASVSVPAVDGDVEFNEIFLQNAGVDVSRFKQSNNATPGTYRLDLFVNDNWNGRAEVEIRAKNVGDTSGQACFDLALLDRIGFDLSKVTPELSDRLKAGECLALPELAKDARVEFDMGEQRLKVSVPQAFLTRQGRGYVDPKHWNEGITAAQLNYNTSVYTARNNGTSTTQSYAGLTAGMNMGSWRLRHNGNVTHDTKTGTRYQSVQTNLRRNLPSMKSQLVIGEAFTDGSTFDSVGFRGVQLSSDDRMYPESQRGYAPTVRGIANTNARVQVRQNGNIIYETTVAPGPFVIDDLYPTGFGGDLEVVVNEADGRVLISKVPFAGAVNSLRPGVTRYSVTAGQYRSNITKSTPAMGQATVQHGISNAVTGYGGLTLAEGYGAVLGGAALNTDFGAFGLDVTQSMTRIPNEKTRTGQSTRLSYTKFLEPTQTSVSLAALRYSSQGYLNLSDAMETRGQRANGSSSIRNGVQRGRLQATINQSLPEGYGSFYFSGSTQDYWNRPGRDTQLQAGYNNNYKSVSYGVSVSRQLNVGTQKWDNQIMLNFGIPLGSGQRTAYASTSMLRGSDGSNSVQQSVAGTLGADHGVNYGVSAGRNAGADGASSTSLAANAAYTSSMAVLSANASTGTRYTQYGAGASGGVVAYSGGVAFTPSNGDTLAIVEAKDAAGARVVNSSGLRVDPWGRAVVSNLTPYAKNSIEIDPKGLPINVELKSTAQFAVPTAGAVVRVTFESENTGKAALLTLKTADGKPIPFGAEVENAKGKSVGTVAQAGRVLARGLAEDDGQLTVKWGEGASESCSVRYTLPKKADKDDTLTQLNGLECRA